LAKKSLETGEECDAVPDCVRQYFAMQAMENGKAFPRGLMGDRSRSLSAYGNGNMLNPEQSPQGKIGMLEIPHRGENHGMNLTSISDPPLHMSFIEHWVLASGWTERDGPCYILFA